MNEIPNRAPPMPESVVQSMAGLAFFRTDYCFGISLLLGFYGMLRTGELLSVKSTHITMSRECGPAVLSLGYTKGGRRMGAAESVTIGVVPLCRFLWKWMHSTSRTSLLLSDFTRMATTVQCLSARLKVPFLLVPTVFLETRWIDFLVWSAQLARQAVRARQMGISEDRPNIYKRRLSFACGIAPQLDSYKSEVPLRICQHL